MQVYKQMDIGTAKVTNEEMDGIPHYMIDILNPDDSFLCTISNYELKLIEDITSRGKIPIIAGGTGLYIQSLIYDYPFDDETVSKEVEQKTQLQLQKLEPLTNQEVHDYLATFDPQSAKDIHPNNRKKSA